MGHYGPANGIHKTATATGTSARPAAHNLDRQDRTADASSTADSEIRAVFCDWAVEEQTLSTGNLNDGADLSNYQITFFDPLRFAIRNRLWSADRPVSDSAYVTWNEKDLERYLIAGKTAADTLTGFLLGNGLLVIRSNIPKAYIKVLKKSAVGTKAYTESVVSAFFWLEELIGKYSLKYISARTIKFASQGNPLQKWLGCIPANCLQTVDFVGKGKAELIAGAGSSLKAPAITRIRYDEFPGEIYLVPPFVAPDEGNRLVQAFRQVWLDHRGRIRRPEWYADYAKDLDFQSPYIAELKHIDLRIRALSKQKKLAETRHKEASILLDLLAGEDQQLQRAAVHAFGLLGMEPLGAAAGEGNAIFDLRIPEGSPRRALILTRSSQSDAIGADAVNDLTVAMAERNLENKAKGVIVANAFSGLKPDDRKGWFSPECREMATRKDVCLISTLELYNMAVAILARLDRDNVDELRAPLLKAIVACDTEFVLDHRKFGLIG